MTEHEHNQLEFRDRLLPESRLLDCTHTQSARHLQASTLPERMGVYRVRAALIREMNQDADAEARRAR